MLVRNETNMERMRRRDAERKNRDEQASLQEEAGVMPNVEAVTAALQCGLDEVAGRLSAGFWARQVLLLKRCYV